MKMIGMIHDPEMSDAQRALIVEKRAAYDAAQSKKTPVASASDVGAASAAIPSPKSTTDASADASGFPPGALMCAKCNTQALVLLDGCQTCLNCGYSKCG
jgi:hypothetical protein